MKRFTFLFCSLLIAVSANAQLRLPHVLSSNMVMQQQTEVSVWGFADPGSKVKVAVSWNKKSFNAVADQDSCWIVKVPTPAATFNPQTVTVSSGKEKIKLENVLIGEVWVCSGQSNMEMPIRGFGNNTPTEDASVISNRARETNGIRVCKLPHVRANVPAKDVTCEWETSTVASVPTFTAVGYTFAESLQKYVDVPVGIIDCSWGGALIEAFMCKESFLKLGVSEAAFDQQVTNNKYFIWTAIYNAMLCPISNFTSKGFLWYQGCSNVGMADYAQYQAEMVKSFRELWQNENMPFYYVLIAPFDYGEDKDFQVGVLREQQVKALDLIPNSAIVNTVDLVYPYEEHNIHPRQKEEIGRRLANMAACKTYGFSGIKAECPQLESVEFFPANSAAVLTFKNLVGGFDTKGFNYAGFELAGEDGVFYPVDNVLPVKDGKLGMASSKVANPVAVRYLFKGYFQPSVWNVWNLPLLPFRTDNWDK